MMITKLVQKIFYKIVGLNPLVDRFVRYRKPREYWQKRGGEGYFQEQEAVHDRTLRSEFIASEIKKLSFHSILEIGCGYGKQLKNIYSEGLEVVGCDFSGPQLAKAKKVCEGLNIRFVESDAEALPFEDKSFDLVLSSAVILHNHYPKAQKVISEMIRVSRKYLVHNEDTDITFSRYGYDLCKTYEKLNFKIIKSIEIPCSQEPKDTQFTIVGIPSHVSVIKPEDIPLQYH
jgi:SAM-dependent methyltransferase